MHSLFVLFHQMRSVHRLEPCEKTEPDSPPFLNKGIFLVANFGEKTLQKVTIVVIVMIIIIIIIVAQAKSQTNMCLANVPSLRSPLAPTPPPRKGCFQVRNHFHFFCISLSLSSTFTFVRSVQLSGLLLALPPKHTQ